MITKENIKYLLDGLTDLEVDVTMNSHNDYIAFELSIFNTGHIATIEPVNYSDELSKELFDNGNMLIDKDEFLQLSKECGTTNKAILNWM